MALTGTGWELLVDRKVIHEKAGRLRTYGDYRVYRDGVQLDGLRGNVCEARGPGDNTAEGDDNDVRVREGTYVVYPQDGKFYTTVGYSKNLETPAKLRMPGLDLQKTDLVRTGILIHPGHPPTPQLPTSNLFLSSVGCFNLTKPLEPDEDMDFWDSRSRVIEVINSLVQFAGAVPDDAPFANATVVVMNEP